MPGLRFGLGESAGAQELTGIYQKHYLSRSHLCRAHLRSIGGSQNSCPPLTSEASTKARILPLRAENFKAPGHHQRHCPKRLRPGGRPLSPQGSHSSQLSGPAGQPVGPGKHTVLVRGFQPDDNHKIQAEEESGVEGPALPIRGHRILNLALRILETYLVLE